MTDHQYLIVQYVNKDYIGVCIHTVDLLDFHFLFRKSVPSAPCQLLPYKQGKWRCPHVPLTTRGDVHIKRIQHLYNSLT